MDKEKSIIIKENGIVIKKYPDSSVESFHASKQEHAATLQESEDDPIPAYDRQTTIEKVNSSNKKSKFRIYKPIVIAISSAILIGLVLSVLMFQLFVNVDAGLNSQGITNIPAFNTDQSGNQEDTNTVNAISSYSLDSLSGYVLQAGVFSEQVNAEEWAQNFIEIGLPTYIWEGNEQFYLLLGLAETKEVANQIVNNHDFQGFDIFVKEWTVNSAEVNMTSAEYEWLTTFREEWLQAVRVAQSGGGLSKENFTNVLSTKHGGSELLTDINNQLSEIGDTTGLEAQQLLLDLMKQYENVIKNR